MGADSCELCITKPVMKCGRCATTCCRRHALAPGQRCTRCERDWQDEAPTRRNAKLIFAPPVSIIAGGLLFGLFLPISLGGMIGAAVMATFALAAAVGAGAGTCKAVDQGARAMFLRERGGGLPTARLLPAPRHR